MIYDNSSVRRQDRLLDESRAIELLKSAEFGILSMIDEDGFPYCVPLNFVWNEADSIYIHCAPEGKKLRALDKNNNVTFCITDNVNLQSSKFTTEYESVILRGTAHCNLSESERKEALVLLLKKLSPNDLEVGLKYIEKSFHRTEIIRCDFISFSGKKKYVNK